MYFKSLDGKEAPARARVMSCTCTFCGVILAIFSQTNDGKDAVAEGICSMFADNFQETLVNDGRVRIGKNEQPAGVIAPRCYI